MTSAIAENIASDKDLTKTCSSPWACRCPKARAVKSPEEAWEAALDIGLPVVVKPSDANHARGVTLDLRKKRHQGRLHVADKEGSSVLVERFIPGVEHRLLVVGGRVVAAARGPCSSSPATAAPPCAS